MKTVTSIILAQVLVGLMTISAQATECKWSGLGADNNMSTSANWEGGEPPKSGDIVILSYANGKDTITNDIANLSIDRMTVSGEKALTITGEKITITRSQESKKTSDDTAPLYTKECHLYVYAPLAFTGISSYISTDGEIDVYAPVEIESKNFSFDGSKWQRYQYGAPVTATNATLTARGWKSVLFYQSLKADQVRVGVDITGDSLVLYCKGGWNDLSVDSGGWMDLMVENVLPSDFVFTWGENANTAPLLSQKMDSYRLEASQAADRIVSSSAFAKSDELNRCKISSITTQDITLTLNGTADATTYAALKCDAGNHLNLVWNPTNNYTQTFSSREHTMDGTIAVRGGTLASAGANTFTGVKGLTVCNGATFAVRADKAIGEEAVNPFTGAAFPLVIEGSGRVEVPAGITLTFSTATVRGVPMDAGTFTEANAGWITGGGSITVTTAGAGTVWKTATDGNFDDETKWSNGLPSDTVPGYIAAEGSDYTVTLKTGVTWPKNLMVVGSDATLEVPAGETVEFGSTANLSISDGATLSVAGTLDVANYAGTFTIGSVTSATSRFEVVTGGLVKFVPVSAASAIVLNKGGALDMRGGEVKAEGTSQTLKNIIAIAGGMMLGDAGTLYLGGPSAAWVQPTLSGEGTFLFAGSAALAHQFTRASDMGAYLFGADSGKRMDVTFGGSSELRLGLAGGVQIGAANSDTIVTYASKRTLSRADYSNFNSIKVTASGTGTAELRVSDGVLNFGGYGFDIGCANDSDTTHGRVVLTGGRIQSGGDCQWWMDRIPYGLKIGYGANATSGSGEIINHGELLITGGTNETTSATGVTLIGIGYGKGAVVQTGGYNYHCSESDLFGLGAAGGKGSWTISGGLLRVRSDAYIGGFDRLTLRKGDQITAWPDLHDAEGALSVSGGTVEFQKDLVLGADGVGTINCVGSKGVFTVGGDLVLSNTTANVQSGGALKFTCDANGVSPIKVTGKVVFKANARMAVDVSAWADVSRRQWLLKAGAFENPIAACDVEVLGRTKATQQAVVRYSNGRGYYVVVPKGLCLIVR